MEKHENNIPVYCTHSNNKYQANLILTMREYKLF